MDRECSSFLPFIGFLLILSWDLGRKRINSLSLYYPVLSWADFWWPDRILAPCNYCHHPWCVGHKSYHKALLIMFGCDGISDHLSWNEVFHYRDTKLSWIEFDRPVCQDSVLHHPLTDNLFHPFSTRRTRSLVDQYNTGVCQCADHYQKLRNIYHSL